MKPWNWPPKTDTLRWCPECHFWTVPVKANRCSCGHVVTYEWKPGVEEAPLRRPL